jgi:predicted house-cleaning noncanonical NTP pyrophosphatase (MazG superfamily)
MRREYHKLVRDRIPHIIRQEGRACEVESLSPDEFRRALLEKLIEEAQEAVQASPDDLAIELADLYEVIDAVMALHHIDRDSVLAIQQQRRAERGGFTKHLRLLWSEVS